MLSSIVNFIVEFVASWGYFGIFAMMFLESSFFPFPSEIVMIPAGYLASQGQMNFVAAFVCGVGGSVAGALFNYYLCYFFGRKIVDKFGKYIGITDEKFAKFEEFFNKHGEISTFNCRLIPGIRQYISLPAGLAKMNVARFCAFTGLGAGIWVLILMILGYFIGENQELIEEKLHIITIALICFVIIISAFYVALARRKKKIRKS